MEARVEPFISLVRLRDAIRGGSGNSCEGAGRPARPAWPLTPHLKLHIVTAIDTRNSGVSRFEEGRY